MTKASVGSLPISLVNVGSLSSGPVASGSFGPGSNQKLNSFVQVPSLCWDDCEETKVVCNFTSTTVAWMQLSSEQRQTPLQAIITCILSEKYSNGVSRVNFHWSTHESFCRLPSEPEVKQQDPLCYFAKEMVSIDESFSNTCNEVAQFSENGLHSSSIEKHNLVHGQTADDRDNTRSSQLRSTWHDVPLLSLSASPTCPNQTALHLLAEHVTGLLSQQLHEYNRSVHAAFQRSSGKSLCMRSIWKVLEQSVTRRFSLIPLTSLFADYLEMATFWVEASRVLPLPFPFSAKKENEKKQWEDCFKKNERKENEKGNKKHERKMKIITLMKIWR